MTAVIPVVLWLLVLAVALAAGAPSPSVERSAGPMRVTLTLNKTAYVRGEGVEVVVTARNEGTTPVRLQFLSGQRFDLIIRRRGAVVWRWSHDKAFTQAIQEVTLAPGGTLTFQGVWPQVDLQGRRVDPGQYEAVGLFLAQLPDGGARAVETPPLVFQIGD